MSAFAAQPLLERAPLEERELRPLVPEVDDQPRFEAEREGHLFATSHGSRR